MQVLGEHRSLQAVIDRLREQLDEEQEARSDLQRQLTRSNNEASVWRQKFESGEGGIRPEEMDDLKKKLGARIHDGEAQLEAALAKVVGLEKAKSRSQMEVEALVAEVEKVGIDTSNVTSIISDLDIVCGAPGMVCTSRKCRLVPPTVKHTGEESGAELCNIFKF